ncbi:MAG: sigma-54-dependent Fis family transcriptional regulator [Halioglobus sp.]|nr:sigma-54-dependent Fis family transcriptional regulator [Halioglobus sp.]
MQERGLDPVVCHDLAAATAVLRERADTIAVAFIALDLPDGGGLDLLGESSLFSDDTEIALMHSEDDPLRARQGIAQQASYFFCKPLDDVFIGELLDDIKQDLSTQAMEQAEVSNCAVDQFGLLRGNSAPMRKLYRMIRKVAATDATVLLVGESGTGKELAAQTLHQMSGLSGPFVAMNCGAIAAELAESELFGHEKGSFSGAHKQHAGYFERAEGGTLLLDEIGEMSMDLQVKLLRVLETRKYRRVGGTQDHEMNVRFVSATNREPEAAIRDGLLREDLYFRIAQFVLKMPPLRTRGKDITGLAQHLLNELNEVNGTAKTFSASSQAAILEYPWPGNVRELKSAVERAYIMAEQQLESEHFPDGQIDLGEPENYLTVSVGETLEHTEKKQIIATLEALDGDKKAAADSLGISLKTLYNRLNEYESPDAPAAGEQEQ